MAERMPWERQENETATAYEHFKAFLAAGPTRDMLSVYRQRTGRHQAAKPSGHWHQWVYGNNWRERADAYDAHIQEQVFSELIEEQTAQTKRELEEFRKANETLGKGLAYQAVRAMKLLNKFLDEKAELKTTDDARHMSTLMSNAIRYAPELWAKAIGIPELEAMLERQEDA